MTLRQKKRGFTLIELIVTIGTFALLTTSLVGNMRNTTKSVVLNNLANRVVTEIRGAQNYSLSSVSVGGAFVPYGVSFDAATPKSFVFFMDKNGNGQYDAPTELINTLQLQIGNTITKVCVNMKADNLTPSNCTQAPQSKMNITFKRPYPEPFFLPAGTPPYSDIDIVLSSDSGLQKTVIVWITGQLAIQ